MLILLGGAALTRAEVSVEDDLGRTVVLPQPARRIVSLAPHLTEMLFAVRAGARVVGVMAYSDYPPEARDLPRVGGYAGLDLEAILALHPDLVLAWESGNPRAQVGKLERLGVPVFVDEPRELDDIPRTLERLGVLTGNTGPARQAAQRFRDRLARLRARYAGRPGVRVFYEIWDQPLVTLNGEHLVSHIIELCGGRNVFADLPIIAPHIGVEAVLAADPEAIFASGVGAERPDWLDAWRRWADLSAVAHDNLFVIPPDLIQRHSPRVLLGAQMLCEDLETARRRLGK